MKELEISDTEKYLVEALCCEVELQCRYKKIFFNNSDHVIMKTHLYLAPKSFLRFKGAEFYSSLDSYHYEF